MCNQVVGKNYKICFINVLQVDSKYIQSFEQMETCQGRFKVTN